MKLMTARLDLIAHGASAATRAAQFPDDDALEAFRGRRTRSAPRLAAALRSRVYRARPRRPARETAAALGRNAKVEAALGDCDYGRWRGLALKDDRPREPDGFAAWLGDPVAAPHGGESLAALLERAGAWLAELLARDGATIAVTHASVARAAIVGALSAAIPRSSGGSTSRCSRSHGSSGREGRWNNLVAFGPLGALVIRLLFALIAALVALGTSPCEAHRISTGSGLPPQGISIPSLTHGQMAVMSDNLSAIRALASARIGFDMTTWRLEDYLSLQSFACLWGVVPGSIADEESAFNECAHAYLAAGRALLLQLRQTPGADHKAVEALIGKIETEMLANGASLTLCRFSDEPFNTNEIIFPRWSEIPLHPPTAAFVVLTIVAIGAATWGAWPRRSVRRQSGRKGT